MRAISLVPSLTDTVAAIGLADHLIGVTDWCTHGAPDGAVRVGGTKNPDVDRIVALTPDVVLANTEENREADLDALRQARVTVLETFPKAVADVPLTMRAVAAALNAPGAADALAEQVTEAAKRALEARPPQPVHAITFIWRKPWMAVGRGTFADDLLRVCGFTNVLADTDDRYPRLDEPTEESPDVVLLPSEPYAFTDEDLPALRDLLGDVETRFVDGRLLTWHGPSTPDALRRFCGLSAQLAAT